MGLYKVLFTGYALVDADSVEEAEELFFDDEWGFIESNIDNIIEVVNIND